jgi:hypothetical protein
MLQFLPNFLTINAFQCHWNGWQSSSCHEKWVRIKTLDVNTPPPNNPFGCPNTLTRLLARVLNEGVQFWYNDTSTVKSRGGGGVVEKMFLWKTFEVYVTSCQYLFQARLKFQTHLALWVCAATLLYLTMTFSFSQAHHQIDQIVKCIIIMRIETILFQIY